MDAIDSSGMMCPMMTTGRPLMCTSHSCVDNTLQPSAKATCRGDDMGHLFWMGVPSMIKMWVAPESAMASVVLRAKVALCDNGLVFVKIYAMVFGGV